MSCVMSCVIGSGSSSELERSLQRKRCTQGHIGPTITRNAAVGSFSFGRSCIQRGQRTRRATFVKKHELPVVLADLFAAQVLSWRSVLFYGSSGL